MQTRAWYERLNATDATFLYLEDGGKTHMHVGGVFVYEGAPPPYPEFVRFVSSRLHLVPRYRQRLAFVPLGLGRPVWVDDPAFDVEYHLRHSALPGAGGPEALKRLAGRVFGQPLDREKPLWELELVENVGPGRFALLSKTHHCLLDGIAGNDVIAAITDGSPAPATGAAAPAWSPRPAPHPVALGVGALREQLVRPLQLAREALDPASAARQKLRDLRAGAAPLLRLARRGRAPRSSLNQPIGPHRRYEMLTFELSALKEARKACEATFNDVVLAIVAGALGRLFEARGEPVAEDLRVFVPVSVRPPGAQGALGNELAVVYCPLPVGERDPLARLARVAEAMRGLKRDREALATLSIAILGELMFPPFAAAVARLEAAYRRYNVVVSNVPGSATPRWFLGRRLLSFHPLIPLAASQTLTVGIHTYAGTVGFGLNADADHVRDLPVFARALADSLAELVAAARSPSKALQQAARAGGPLPEAAAAAPTPFAAETIPVEVASAPVPLRAR
jgi:WS/DGAT/MGAT family acyltransferase